MSGYITITPKYEPLDLDTMLKVPMMLTEEKDKQNKDIEEYKDKISKFKAMLGPDADKVFGDYDKLVGLIQPNSTVQELKDIASQMKENYRDRNAKLEAAVPAYEAQRKKFNDNPDLLGDPGTLFTYYNDPTYNPFTADGKKISEEASEAMKAVVAGQTPEYMGKLKGDPSKLLYRRGFSDEQLEEFIEDATSGNPQTNMGKIYNNILKKYGYDNLDPYNKERAKKYLRNSLNEGRYQTSTTSDPDYAQRQAFYRNQRAKGRVSGLPGDNWRIVKGKEDEDTQDQTFAIKEEKNGDLHIYKKMSDGTWKPATSFTDVNNYRYTHLGEQPGYFPTSIKSTNTEYTSVKIAGGVSDDGKKLIPTGAFTIDEIENQPKKFIPVVYNNVITDYVKDKEEQKRLLDQYQKFNTYNINNGNGKGNVYLYQHNGKKDLIYVLATTKDEKTEVYSGYESTDDELEPVVMGDPNDVGND